MAKDNATTNSTSKENIGSNQGDNIDQGSQNPSSSSTKGKGCQSGDIGKGDTRGVI